MARSPFTGYLTLGGDPLATREMGDAAPSSIYQFNHIQRFRATITGMTIELGANSSFREIGYGGDNQPLSIGWDIVKTNRREAGQLQSAISPQLIRRNVDLKFLGDQATYEDTGSSTNFLRIKLNFPEGAVTLSDSTENIQARFNDQMNVEEQRIWVEGYLEPIPSTG